LTCSLLSLVSLAANSQESRPNIVLIMADDMGYECLSCNGSLSYQTPNLDRIAEQGIRFTHCISQPLSTPSRLKMMTGKYNYRNYEYFEYLNPSQKTFGNYLKEAGYLTCIAGKWQLNGIFYNLPGNQDIDRPHHFGFDEYCLWQLNQPRENGERYANPLIIKNGLKMEGLGSSYGPDIFSDFICDFIDRSSDKPFFIYYPMVLVHDPFVPTPDSPEWVDPSGRYERNNLHFKEMVEYTDKIVAKIESKLKEKGVLDNTILIFTGDNGTNVSITTLTKEGPLKGGKSFTTDAGCHVPLIVSWPKYRKSAGVYDPLIDFSDFAPTLIEAAGGSIAPNVFDGKSYLPVLKGESGPNKETVFVHYDPQWGNASKNRNRFARTIDYKLYLGNRFYKVNYDPLELNPLSKLTEEENKIRTELQKILDKAENESPWIERRNNEE
jgi:arylsulfatase A